MSYSSIVLPLSFRPVLARPMHCDKCYSKAVTAKLTLQPMHGSHYGTYMFGRTFRYTNTLTEKTTNFTQLSIVVMTVAHGNVIQAVGFLQGNMRFSSVSLEKLIEILEPLLVYVIILVRPTNTPNLIEIGSQGGAPTHSGEIIRFCDLFSHSIRTFFGSNDVFCLVHVPFRGMEPSTWRLLHGPI